MGLFDSIVKGVKSAAGAVSGAASSVGDYFKGAQETLANYLEAYDENRVNGPEFTLEMKQKALTKGPVGSFAYRMELSNQWLLKNPGEIVMIGSTGKVGKVASKVKGADKVLEYTKKGAKATAGKAAGTIKNVPGFTTAIAKKVAANKGFSSIFKGTFGKVLGVGGLITGAGLLITNTLDFYNWNGPIQTALKQKFPWLFPAVNNAKAGKKTPEIRRLSPDETRQLQQLFFDQTGIMYTGEELRKLIYDEFGITVLEERPTKGNAPGPLAVVSGGGVQIPYRTIWAGPGVAEDDLMQRPEDDRGPNWTPVKFARPPGGVAQTAAKPKITAAEPEPMAVLPSQFPAGYVAVPGRANYAVASTPNYLISTQGDLQMAALNEVAAFLNALPGRMSFDFIFKKSFKDNEGNTRKGSFAFLRIKVFTKTGGQSTLAELPLGTIPAELYNPGQLNADAVSVNVSSYLSGSVEPANLAPMAEMPAVMPDTAPDIFRPTIQRQRVLVKPGNFIAYIDKIGDYYNADVGGELLLTSNAVAAARKRGEITEIVGYNPDYFAELQATKSTI